MSKTFTRRTTPYGVCINPKQSKRFREYADQISVRQLNFNSGGIGAGLWDASIILSRFILKNPAIFAGKDVHEVGAGIALPALYSSFFARRVIMSDYLTPLIDNFNYNIKSNINSIASAANEDLIDYTQRFPEGKNFLENPIWDIMYTNQLSVQKKYDDLENDKISTQPEIDYPMIDINQYYTEHQEEFDQFVNTTISRPVNQTQDEFVDLSRGGYLPPNDYSTWTLDTHTIADFQAHRQACYDNMYKSAQSLVLDWLQYPTLPQSIKQDLKCDIILGSEVSYPTILDTLPSLIEIITSTLSHDGVFYLVQSPNRGTSLYFIEELCNKYQFLLDMRAVPCDIELHDFSSGQRQEDYVYYTFRRPNSPFSIMGDDCDLVAPPEGLSEDALKNINTNKLKRVCTSSNSSTELVPCNEVVFTMKLAVPAN